MQGAEPLSSVNVGEWANCVFKDQNGFTTSDETPFTMVILTENATEDVKFVSMNNLAKKFTIRVRQAR